MEYREVVQRDRDEIELLLRSSDKTDRSDGLLSAAYYDSDWRWVQNQCLGLLRRDDVVMCRLAATCLGHVARVHRQLDLDVVLAELTPLKDDPNVGGYVQDALDDIRFFLRFQ
jgi:hypothetical protein